MTDARFPTGEEKGGKPGAGPQVRDRAPAGIAAGPLKKLRAGDRAVGTKAGAVEGGDERGAGERLAVGGVAIGKEGRGVGLVVLDLKEGNAELDGKLPGKRRGEIAGMEVGGDRRGADGKQGEEMAGGALEGGERRGARDVADMLAHPGVATAGDTERRLELATDGEEIGAVVGQGNRQRRVAARAAEGEEMAGGETDDGVVAGNMDGAVVKEKAVDDGPEVIDGAGIVVFDRGACDVAGSHHKRRHRPAVGGVEKEGMEREGGKHDADMSDPRGHGLGKRGACRKRRPIPTLGQQHDRPLGALEEPALGRREAGKGGALFGRGNDHSQRLRGAVFPRSQPGDRGGIRGIADKMESPHPLHGEDRARAEGSAGGADRVVAAATGRRGPPCVSLGAGVKPDHRPASRAADRLGMKAAVGRIGILANAVGAEGKGGERRRRSVVGERADDGKARAAVGAVGKRMAMAAVRGIVDLRQTGRAGGDVGRKRRRPPGLPVAVEDREARGRSRAGIG